MHAIVAKCSLGSGRSRRRVDQGPSIADAKEVRKAARTGTETETSEKTSGRRAADDGPRARLEEEERSTKKKKTGGAQNEGEDTHASPLAPTEIQRLRANRGEPRFGPEGEGEEGEDGQGKK